MPEGDSYDSPSSQQLASSDSSRPGITPKRMKVDQIRVPESLQHFLPSNIEFDPLFEPRVKDSRDRLYDQFLENEDVSSEFILFCNHLLKQIFGMHGFNERSLRGRL